MAAYLKIKLRHSAIARTQRQKDTLRGLGLRHLHQVKILKNSPAVRGLVHKVIHLVDFEETGESKLPEVQRVETFKLGAKGTPKKAVAKPKPAAKKPAEKAEKAEAKKKPAAKKSAGAKAAKEKSSTAKAPAKKAAKKEKE